MNWKAPALTLALLLTLMPLGTQAQQASDCTFFAYAPTVGPAFDEAVLLTVTLVADDESTSDVGSFMSEADGSFYHTLDVDPALVAAAASAVVSGELHGHIWKTTKADPVCTVQMSQLEHTNRVPSVQVRLDPITASPDDDILATPFFKDPDGDEASVVEYDWEIWDFGTGWASVGHSDPTLPATFTADGERWRVNVAAQDPFGGVALYAEEVLITDGGTLPVASITAPLTTDLLDSNTPIAFNASSSGDPNTLRYRWDLDGDGFWDATGWDASNTTTAPGFDSDIIATVVLEVEDVNTEFRGRATADFTINHAPVAGTFSLTPSAPDTGDSIVASITGTDPDDGHTVAIAYSWTRDGLANPITGDTLDAAQTVKNETWTATATLTDGHGGETLVEQPFTIGNSAPSIDLALTPASADTLTDLTVVATVTDPDGDTIAYCDVVWKVNDVVVSSSTDQDDAPCAGHTLTADNHTKGDVVRVESTAHDDHDPAGQSTVFLERTIVDAPPTLSVEMPASVTSSDDLVPVVLAVDPDEADTVTCTYVWTHSGPGSDPHEHQGSGCSPFLVSSDLIRDDQWSLEVNATSDGESVVQSAGPITVQNSAPVPQDFMIFGGSDTAEALDVSFDPVDADGDSLTCTVVWSLEGVDQDTFTDDCTTGDFSVPSESTVRGQAWSVAFTADDGMDTTTVTDSVTIGNAPPAITASLGGPYMAGEAPVLTMSLSDADEADGDAAPSCTLAWVHLTGLIETSHDPVPCDGGGSFTYPDTDTARGDLVTANVTLVDGEDSTLETHFEQTKIIANTPPVVDSIGTPVFGASHEGISVSVAASDVDGDDLTCEFEWNESGGASIATASLCSEGFLDGNLYLVRGDSWTFTVKAIDDSDESEPVAYETPMEIGNSIPVVQDVSFDDLTPNRGDPVTLTLDCDDNDWDDVEVTLQWTGPGGASRSPTPQTVNGKDVNCALQDTLPASMTSQLGDWSVTVTLMDEVEATSIPHEATFTVTNQLPTADITVTPALPKTKQSFAASFTTSDPDSADTVTATGAWIAPYVTTITGATVLAEKTEKGQTWTYRVTLDDGHETTTVDKVVQIQNTPPTATGVTITPKDPGAGEDLTASFLGAADADGEADLNGGTFQWVNQNGQEFTGKTLVGSLTVKDDLWTVTATPLDADNAAGSSVVATVKILAADTDGDGVRDDTDNCISVANEDQANYDKDANGDACDSDDDDDGFPDINEVASGSDPRNAASVPNDVDGDGIANDADNCPTVSNPQQKNLDGDAFGDACDDDRDDDGYPNDEDGVPDDKRYHLDADKDGVADEIDACPGHNDHADLDKDGVADGCDIDDDGDGVPDGHDRFPRDPAESKDDDRDGIGNNADNCLDKANPGQEDVDKDGIGDACDDDQNTPVVPEVDPTTPPKLERPSKLSVALSKGKARIYFSPPPAPTSSHYLIWRFSEPELIGTVALEPGKTSYFFDAGAVPDGEHHYGVIGIDSLAKKDAAVALVTGTGDVRVGPAVTKDGFVDCPAGAIDQDRDGICDRVETQMGLDPLNADSDGDGRLDGEEMLDTDSQGFGDASNAVEPGPGAAASVGAGGRPAWFWLLLGGVVLVAAGVAVGVWYVLRNKSGAEGSKAEPSWVT